MKAGRPRSDRNIESIYRHGVHATVLVPERLFPVLCVIMFESDGVVVASRTNLLT